ncbi:hypothetical protein LPJ61_001019 [Coemansia biformis]|uniref:Vacuolar protein sorting-associated protein 54 n=1 Tax=Coemansia biformis TaxID=1286918 RepID=A0A9W7YFZ7_9FUNG|nr:hypothetical protein LPJ61_001019 [Coemansia biformis]
MKRQSGIGIIRDGAGSSSYFQRRVQPMTGASQGAPTAAVAATAVAATATADPPPGAAAAKEGTPERQQLHGLNAIAVLTNHPNKAPARIHRSELPAVPRTLYPAIKCSDFDEYLASTAALFEQYAANAKSGYQVATDELCRGETAADDADKGLDMASHTYSMDSTTMAERLKALDGTRSEFGLDSISEYGGGNANGTAARALLGIEDVPTIFFEEGFDLRDPATFDIATQVVLGPAAAGAGLFSPDNAAEASNTMQEMLSRYMDVVEAYLTREISRRSPAFFAALSTLEELYSETDRCIDKIHAVRDDLKKTARAQCLPGLELIRQRRRKTSLEAVLRSVELLSTLQHTLAAADELIESGDYVGALSLLNEARELAEPAGEQPQNMTGRAVSVGSDGLTGTRAFGHLRARMDKSLRAVTQHAERELAAIVLRDMREFVDDGLSGTQGGPSGRLPQGPLGPQQVEIYQANLVMQLTPFVCGLARTGGIGSALKTYRASLMSETAGLVEGLYPSEFPRSKGHAMFSDAAQQRALGAAVRGQTFDQFCALLRQQQDLLVLVISHISMVRRTFLQILEENRPSIADEDGMPAALADREPPSAPLASGAPQFRGSGLAQDPASPLGRNSGSGVLAGSAGSPPLLKRFGSARAEVLQSLDDTFDEFMDVAHVRCAKLLNHRSEQNARLSLAGFHSLYTWIWQFIVQCERIGGKMCFGLRGALTAQAKAFLANFHAEKQRQVQVLIENEQWVQAEVPVDFQDLVNRVVDAAGAPDGSPHALLSLGSGPPVRPQSSTQSEPSGSSGGAPPSAAEAASTLGRGPAHTLARVDSDAVSIRSVNTAGVGQMHIGDGAFHVVGCSLVLVKSVVEYLQCAASIPVLATDVVQRLVEVFKAFNSRSCQVVLGAGAMRSAGLKNISAKHLALASESLSLCMELIPYVKECLRRAMPPSGEALLAQLERVVGDFASHQQELHHKLVVIMADRADHHARALDTTRWDELGSQAQPPAPAMDALVKEVRKLHKVLKRYLPPSALRAVFDRIFAVYETRLTAQYRRMRIATSEGKRQLMLNSQYLLQRLRALDTSLPVDWELEVVVNNIDLVRSRMPAATPLPSSSPPPPPPPSLPPTPATAEPPFTAGSEPATPAVTVFSPSADAAAHGRASPGEHMPGSA